MTETYLVYTDCIDTKKPNMLQTIGVDQEQFLFIAK